MINKSEETLQPFYPRYKHKTPSGKGEVKAAKPVKFCLHRNGAISVRVDGGWHHGQELTPSLYLSAPTAVRQRIIRAEYLDGKPRVSGSAVLVQAR